MSTNKSGLLSIVASLIFMIIGILITINCRVESGSPQPTVEWKREGDDKALESDGGVLTINKVTRHMVRVHIFTKKTAIFTKTNSKPGKLGQI